MAGQVDIKAGETKEILWIFSSSIPGKIRFHAQGVDDEPARGKIHVDVNTLFNARRDEFDLAAENVLNKGFWDANYKVSVTPETDTKIEFQTRHFRAGTLFIILAAIMILGIVSAAIALFFAAPSGPPN